MTASIPASSIVNINPSVIGAGGTGLDLSGVFLTNSTRVPTGTVQTFTSAAAVSTFFGPSSAEALRAAVYFAGYDGSNIKPAAMLFTQYPSSAVPAYLKSGQVSTLSLAQLQAIAGNLTLNVNGVAVTSGAISLTGAASFSAAAALIQTAFNYADAVVTGTIGCSFTGAIATSILTISGTIVGGAGIIGAVLTGTGVAVGTTVIALLSGTLGATGSTYSVSNTVTAASTAITGVSSYVNVTAVTSGTIYVGQAIAGVGTIQAFITGTGGVGSYTVTNGAYQVAGTIRLGALLVTYDSVSGSFLITGGTPGTPGTITVATGTAATALKFTTATGAITSQGAPAATPATFMPQVTAASQNWATFTTIWEPITADKIAFAAWASTSNNRYLYIMWDTDLTVTTNANTASAGYAIVLAGYSGVAMIYEPSDLLHGAFLAGAIASIDFTQREGRTNLSFKSQAGLTAGVTSKTVADQLIANGYNFYGTYATAADDFTFFYPGSVTGPFLWIDSYVNEINLNNGFQLDLMGLLTSTKSIPYNAAGYGLIEAALTTRIANAVTFGTIRAGVTLSSLQIAEVNAAAGMDVATTIQQRGWYLQVADASPAVRAARGSPPVNFWYTDGQSIQKISLNSVQIA